MLQNRSLVFVGSSAEGLPVAKAVQAELEHAAECVIWHQGVFGLSDGTLEALVNALSTFDFAVLVLTPDDLMETRGTRQLAPRDNVLLELGMFIGGIGKNRTYMVVDSSAKMKLPSDLAGITPATFHPPQGGTMRSAVGPACTEIEGSIRKLGPRRLPASIAISGSFFMDVTLGTGIQLIIKNISERDFPPYNVVLSSDRGGSWSIFPSTKSATLLPEQERLHRCVLTSTKGEKIPFVGMLRRRCEEEPSPQFVFHLVLEDSKKVLFEDPELGGVLARLIASAAAGTAQAPYDETLEIEFFDLLHRKWPISTPVDGNSQKP